MATCKHTSSRHILVRRCHQEGKDSDIAENHVAILPPRKKNIIISTFGYYTVYTAHVTMPDPRSSLAHVMNEMKKEAKIGTYGHCLSLSLTSVCSAYFWSLQTEFWAERFAKCLKIFHLTYFLYYKVLAL